MSAVAACQPAVAAFVIIPYISAYNRHMHAHASTYACPSLHMSPFMSACARINGTIRKAVTACVYIVFDRGTPCWEICTYHCGNQ